MNTRSASNLRRPDLSPISTDAAGSDRSCHTFRCAIWHRPSGPHALSHSALRSRQFRPDPAATRAPPCSIGHFKPEDTMRSLLVAATLGLGLLSAGTTIRHAAAAPFHDRAPANIGEQLTPAHDQRGYDHRGHGRQYYAPPPPPHHSWRH